MLDSSAASDSETKAVAASLADASSSNTSFRLVVGLFLVYALGLIVMAVSIANPVILNPRQIRNSPLIVQGKVTAIQNNKTSLEVETVFRGKNLLAVTGSPTIIVRDLGADQVSQGESWILPLTPVSVREYVVTPLTEPPQASQPGVKQSNLIYPADPTTIDNLKSRLSSSEISP